ncbi:MAG: ribonuclease III [Ruminococcaceae bacterium]|nr:ribonuclease III [Oscillospiraceae bacterium]
MIKELPDVLLLSYLGDSVFEVLVRERLIKIKGANPQSCNKESLSYVSAPFQAEAAKRLADHFSEDEAEIFRHGKNAKSNSNPRNTSLYTYRIATGLEAVFGYNYYINNNERNRELFELGFPCGEKEESE